MQVVVRAMEDMVMKFAEGMALTVEEQRVVVIDEQESALLRTNKVFLVGRVLTRKAFNKDLFKRQMVNIWRPKTRVTIVELEGGLFSFGFDSRRERALVQKGGPWLYDGALLVLAEADNLAHPASIPLLTQEFWVQVKGLPLPYMTRHIGQFIGNQIGTHILTDQSRKGELLGNILRIRVELNINAPLRRSLLLSIQGTEVRVEVRYEKLPITCFLCGIIGHMEEQCAQFKGIRNGDDLSKPYGRWFQNDVMGDEYRRPQGKRFGLEPEQGWVMKAPQHVDEEERTRRCRSGRY